MNSDEHNLIEQGRPVVQANGKWRLGGFVAYFQQEHEWLRQRIPDPPPYLPEQCVDPVQIAGFFGINLDEFDFKGSGNSQILAAIQRIEDRLDGRGTRRSNVDKSSEMLNTKEVSQLLGCSYPQARKLMLDGRLKSIKDGRLLRSRKDWVEEYLLAKTVQKPEPQIAEVKVKRPKVKLVGDFKKGGIAYEFLRSRPD
jgi:excisionase family DNA binding protein